jgi:hypothetical protein
MWSDNLVLIPSFSHVTGYVLVHPLNILADVFMSSMVQLLFAPYSLAWTDASLTQASWVTYEQIYVNDIPRVVKKGCNACPSHMQHAAVQHQCRYCSNQPSYKPLILTLLRSSAARNSKELSEDLREVCMEIALVRYSDHS